MKIPKFLIYFCILAFPVCANATRRYVSATGNDAGACAALTSPCRTFQFAESLSSSGDEIDAIDAGDFGSLSIGNIAITIDGGNAGFAEDITVGSGSIVIIRNLSISACCLGISSSGPGTLRVEHVSIIGTSTAVHGVICSAGSCVLDDVHISNISSVAAAGAIVASNGSQVSVSNSVLAFNSIGVTAVTQAIVQVDNCMIHFNTVGASVNDNGNAATGGTIRLSNTTITDNSTGLQSTATSGAIVTFGNNRIFGNEAKVVAPGGNPTISTSVR